MFTRNSPEKSLFIILTVVLLSFASSADESKLDIRWRQTMPDDLKSFEITDFDGNGEKDILIVDAENKLFIYDVNGSLNKTFTLPPPDEVGVVYSLKVGDLNKDSVPEIIIGFGARKQSVSHAWDEYFNYLNESVGRHTRFLYRSVRNLGEIMVLNTSGDTIWRKTLNHSVNALDVADIDLDGHKEIIAGTGSFSKEEYWELIEKSKDAGEEVWDLVEYNFWNSSVVVLTDEGEYKSNWSFMISSERSNKITSVAADDLIGDMKVEVLATSDNGFLYTLSDVGTINDTYNVSAGLYFLTVEDLTLTKRKEVIIGVGDNTIHALDWEMKILWKYKLPNVPQDIDAADIDGDDILDIFVGARDSHIYLFYENGALRWKHFTGEPVYKILVSDLDADEILEVVTASSENLTVYNFNKKYIKREMGNVYYSRSYERYRLGDTLLARIYAQKARDLYLESEDITSLPRVDLLLRQIQEDILSNKKTEAEYNYGRALELYGQNKYEDSQFYLLKAKEIYVELNDVTGVAKIDLLLQQIDDEIRLRKSLRADGLYADALSYFGFRNFTAAKQHAEESKRIYLEIEDAANAVKIDGFVIQIGNEYFDSARRSLIGLEYDKARDQASLAKEIYIEYNHSAGVEKVIKLEIEINRYSEQKPNPIYSILTRLLPYLLVVLVIILAYSFWQRRKESSGPYREKNLSDSLAHDLDEMI